MHHATYRSYIIGFLLSLVMTLFAYGIVVNNLFGNEVILAIIGLAIIQLYVQLFFFLHIGKLTSANLIVVLFALLVVLTVVVGSLWIMNNLNYNMMPGQMDRMIMQDEGMHK